MKIKEKNVTEIPQNHFRKYCKKSPVCKFLGTRNEKDICLKGTQFAPAIIQLQLSLSKEADGNEIASGDNCVGMDIFSDDISVPAV